MTNDAEKEPSKKAKKLTKIFATAIFGGGVLLAGYLAAPHSDRENAEKTLKSMGYTVVEYEGTTWSKGRDRSDFYTDEFKVIPPGQKNIIDVVVASGPAVGSTIKIIP
jgi:hypothetical protein